MDAGEILGSLSEADMEKLKNAASQLLGQMTDGKPKENPPAAPAVSPDILSTAAAVSKAFGGPDRRCELISALKPMLREERQKRADEAIRLLRLISVIPMLKDSGLLGGLFKG